MAFSTKVDRTGLSTTFSSALEIRDDNENIAAQNTYEPEGEHGQIIEIESYGDDSSPDNNFALKGQLVATAGQIKLGSLVTVGASPNQKKFRLKSFKISTKANSPVSISATSEQVEAGASNVDTNNYVVPAFTLDTDHLAQILFSAFTVTGQGANLTSADYEATLDVSKDKLVGLIISSGVGKAVLTASGTILVKGDVRPQIAAGQGWVVVQQPTCKNPETAYKEYSFSLRKPLALYTSAVNASA